MTWIFCKLKTCFNVQILRLVLRNGITMDDSICLLQKRTWNRLPQARCETVAIFFDHDSCIVEKHEETLNLRKIEEKHQTQIARVESTWTHVRLRVFTSNLNAKKSPWTKGITWRNWYCALVQGNQLYNEQSQTPCHCLNTVAQRINANHLQPRKCQVNHLASPRPKKLSSPRFVLLDDWIPAWM